MRTANGGISLISAGVRGTIDQLNEAVEDIAMLAHGLLPVEIGGGGDLNLTAANCRARVVRFIGVLSAARTLFVPATETGRAVIFENATTGGFSVTIKLAGEGGAGVAVPSGQNRSCYHNGVNMRQVNT